MILPPFEFARLPRLIFGSGSLRRVAGETARFGPRALLVTGAGSHARSPWWPQLTGELSNAGIEWTQASTPGEPSPELIDGWVEDFRERDFDAVVGVGGGSALDAAKAVAGLLRSGTSVLDHLEGVGRGIPYEGPETPFIAVPTTAGTGSEATKNAVLSRQGPDGFKKSFRDEKLVARVAIIDPDLLATCPHEVMAANGMDAFTQLLESFVSVKANPMTDALAWSGMEAFVRGFERALSGEATGRADIAYAACLSGVTLAQVGLGSVHGLASPLGAFFPIPHGVVCGTLVAEATRINIEALGAREPDSPGLRKYAEVGALLSGRSQEVAIAGADDLLAGLVDHLTRLTERLGIARLGAYGVTDEDIGRIAANCRGGSMKTNPLVLDDDEVASIVKARI